MSFNDFLNRKKYNLTQDRILSFDANDSVFKPSSFPLTVDTSSSGIIRLESSKIHITGNINVKNNLTFSGGAESNELFFINDSSNRVFNNSGDIKFNNNIIFNSNLYIEKNLSGSSITGSLTECSQGEDLIIAGTGCKVRKKVVNQSTQWVISEGASRNSQLYNTLNVRVGSIDESDFNSDFSVVGNTNSINKLTLGSTASTAKLLKFGKRIVINLHFNNQDNKKFWINLDSNHLYDHILPGTIISLVPVGIKSITGAEVFLQCYNNAFFHPVYGSVYKKVGDKLFYFNLMPHNITNDGVTITNGIRLGKYTTGNGQLDGSTNIDDVTEFLNENQFVELLYCGNTIVKGATYKLWIFA